jgi:hypothetical protein
MRYIPRKSVFHKSPDWKLFGAHDQLEQELASVWYDYMYHYWILLNALAGFAFYNVAHIGCGTPAAGGGFGSALADLGAAVAAPLRALGARWLVRFRHARALF